MLSARNFRRICSGLCLSVLLLQIVVQGAVGAECSGATYNSTAFDEETSLFSPYDTIYLIISCSGLVPGTYTMHVNWVHDTRGAIRSDKHVFETDSSEKLGIYFWFKLSKKGPMASMFSNQDFHEENFGEWRVDTYLDDELVLTNLFSIEDGVQ